MTVTKTYNLQQVLIAWIVNNNPSATRQVLINNSLISAGSNPSKTEMARVLYSYYLSNGNGALFTILKQIPVNENISDAEKLALANTYEELKAASMGFSTPSTPNNARVGESANAKFSDILDYGIKILVGGSETTVAPTVTTTTTTSPIVIVGLIAGVLIVLGLAYIFIGKRGVA